MVLQSLEYSNKHFCRYDALNSKYKISRMLAKILQSLNVMRCYNEIQNSWSKIRTIKLQIQVGETLCKKASQNHELGHDEIGL